MLNGACWTSLGRALELEEGYDVVMPDARGHENSGTPDHGYRYHALAADVASLIDALGLATPVPLGHSMDRYQTGYMTRFWLHRKSWPYSLGFDTKFCYNVLERDDIDSVKIFTLLSFSIH